MGFTQPTNANEMTLSFPREMKDALLSISDMAGRKVYSKTASGTSILVDVRSLPSGTYIIKVQEGNRIYSEKFIRN